MLESGSVIKTRTKLIGVYRGQKAAFRIQQLSTSPPQKNEYERMVAAAQSSGQPLPTQIDALKRAQQFATDCAEVKITDPLTQQCHFYQRELHIAIVLLVLVFLFCKLTITQGLNLNRVLAWTCN